MSYWLCAGRPDHAPGHAVGVQEVVLRVGDHQGRGRGIEALCRLGHDRVLLGSGLFAFVPGWSTARAKLRPTLTILSILLKTSGLEDNPQRA